MTRQNYCLTTPYESVWPIKGEEIMSKASLTSTPRMARTWKYALRIAKFPCSLHRGYSMSEVSSSLEWLNIHLLG